MNRSGKIHLPTPENLHAAAEVLRRGGVVAFPTETVYGLGADAQNDAAVGRIFKLKGRPETHPLIVHLADAALLPEWAREIPDLAWTLAERFWPGPLTLILKRTPRVPNAVTGGLGTVGLRVPAHPAALALLRSFGGGIAAPSANRFGRVSATTAAHVVHEFGGTVDFVLDGGPCRVGIESTIVDLSSGAAAILRPGGVTREELEAAIRAEVPVRAGGAVRSPGQLASHYAPHAEVVLVAAEELADRAKQALAKGQKVAVLAGPLSGAAPPGVLTLAVPGRPADFARMLYTALREADAQDVDVVLASPPPEDGLGLAIADRLKKAAGPRNRGGKQKAPGGTKGLT
jgi:L-threonylcarbamoyladenylate synthase